MEPHATQKMGVFILVWLGQLLSLLGSGLTSFALGIWVYQQTGSITQFSLISMFSILPSILLFPLAGALVDRWDRRWVMLVCDTGSGLALLVIAYLVFHNSLATWHIYCAVAINSIFSAGHWPAYTAAATLLIPKQFLSQGTGMMQIGEAARLLSPVLGGVLLETVQLQGVILIDCVTFAFAFVTLLFVRFPQVLPSAHESIIQGIAYGWRYIRQRVGLLTLVLFMAGANFLLGMVEVLATPMALSFTSPTVLGIVFSIGGLGILTGSALISHRKLQGRLIYGVLGSQLVSGLSIALVGLSPNIATLTTAVFVSFFGLAMINGCSQLILRKKVELQIQGRVFAFSRTLSDITIPLAFGVVGLLVESVFEPWMAADGLLASTVGRVIGVGAGQGIRLLLMVVGGLTVLSSIFAGQYPRLVFVEQELPDITTCVAPQKST